MNKRTDGLTIAMLQTEIKADPLANAKRILKRANRAVTRGADIVVGSEMMLSHYVSGDRYEDDAFIAEVTHAVSYIASAWQHEAVLIIGGIATGLPGQVGEDGRLRKYNAAFVIQNGVCIQNQAGLPFATKSLLPNYRIFDDARHFFSLRQLAMERGMPVSALLQPFRVTVRNRTLNLGVMLCEDMWDSDYALKPARHLTDHGADILINLSCSPWSWQKNRKRDQVVRDICQKTGVPFIYVNNVGVQNNGKNFIVFDGASTAYDHTGNIIKLTQRYQGATQLVTLRAEAQVLQRGEQPDEAELYQAIMVATRGYVATLPSDLARRVVIGVSGGIDSALSVAFFAKVLGHENVIAVNLPYGDYNAKETKDDAAELCRRLQVAYRVIPIDELVDTLCKETNVRPGSAQHKTVQATTRLQVLAAVASQEHAFLSCNANMTEIAFGYGTLNGDLRGTFAPWLNCLKQDVYRLADYLNRVVYQREVIPESIINRPPMDELTAAHGERHDPFHYGSLDYNGYHDQMVRALVAFRRSPEWFLEQYIADSLEAELRLPTGTLQHHFPTPADFVADLERCVTLFHASVFKRVQSVPGPLVDKRSFGWDLRESVAPWVKTQRYQALRKEVLGR